MQRSVRAPRALSPNMERVVNPVERGTRRTDLRRALMCWIAIPYVACAGPSPELAERAQAPSRALPDSQNVAAATAPAQIPTLAAGAAAPEPAAAEPSSPALVALEPMPLGDGWSTESAGQCERCKSPPCNIDLSQRDTDDMRKAPIGHVWFRGDLCGKPENRCVASADGGATVLVGTTLNGGANVTGSCSIAFDLDVPHGYQMAMPTVLIKGLGGRATVTRTYAFEGETPSVPIVSKLSSTDFSIQTDRPELWSPSCAGTSRVRFIATLEVSQISQDQGFALDSFDIATHMIAGVKWRRCGQQWTAEPPRQLGELCDDMYFFCEQPLLCAHVEPGEPRRCAKPDEPKPPRQLDERCEQELFPCEPPLKCQYSATKGTNVCVGPDEPEPANGAPGCGGPLHLPCSGEQICWYEGGQPLDDSTYGTCVEPVVQKGFTCMTGWPQRECVAGTQCWLEKHECAVANGEYKAACGEGLVPCIDPLVCVLNRCNYPQACTNGSCPAGDYCERSTRTCVKLDGRADAPCDEGQPECQVGLVCHLGRCNTPQQIDALVAAAVAAAAYAAEAAATAATEAAQAAADAADAAVQAQTDEATAAAADAARAAQDAAAAAQSAAEHAALAAEDDTVAEVAQGAAGDAEYALDAALEAAERARIAAAVAKAAVGR